MFFKKKRYDYEELAKKLSVLLSERSNPNDHYRRLLKFLCEVFETEGASLILKEGERFVVRQSVGWENFSFRMEECLPFIEWIRKDRGTVTRQQLFSEKTLAPIKKIGLNFFIQFQAEACLPLFLKEELTGFITLSLRRSGKSFARECRKLLDWMGVQFSLSLQNRILAEQVSYQNMEFHAVKSLKSQILANISHELKTPLTGIIGFAELLAEEIDGVLNEEQKKHLDHVLEGSNRLLKVLSALVELAKLESGDSPFQVQQFHLAPLVHSLTEELPLSHGTKLNIELGNGIPRVYGDLGMVKRIFQHLLDNAVKYTPEGKIEVSAQKKGEMLEVCIADTGIGISNDKLTKIFENFYQGDGSITRKFEGSGIGLSLSRKLVDLHGGRLWVQSALGKGSSFYFTLPLKPIAIKHRELAA